MKNTILRTVMSVLFLVSLCIIQVQAASNVSTVLTADVKTKESAYVMFEGSKMDCSVVSSSKYPIKFQEYGCNSASGTNGVLGTAIIYNVGANGTVAIKNKNSNYHKVKLTGWNVTSSVKGCIGAGKIY